MKSNLTSLQHPILRLMMQAAIVTAALSGCTKNNPKPDGGSVNGASVAPERIASIQKTQSINVGESNSIWTVGLLTSPTNTLSMDVQRISLTPGENFKKMEWSIPLDGPLGTSGSGSRTFLSEWGFLIGRGSTDQNGLIALYVVDHIQNVWKKVFSTSGAINGSRGTVFAYRVRGKDGQDYNFIAIAFMEAAAKNIRIERFLVDPNQTDLMKRFTRVRAFSTPAPAVTSEAAVYTGFLYPNCAVDGCHPRFYGGFGNQVQGFDMTADVPPAPASAAMMAAPLVDPPNLNFASTSHPKESTQPGKWGSINDFVYSMAGDPDDGFIFRSADAADEYNNSHVAYDRINQIVYRIGKESRIGPTGFVDTNQKQPLVTAFKRGCFFDPAMTNCDPSTTKNSRMYTDVGEEIGPASDLGNGCVALLGWRRPGDTGANDFKPGVYTACIRDPNDLDKGIAVTKIAEATGATYMYNDFTGASLADRPVSVLFDFSEKKMDGMKVARFYWVPKLGFTNTMVGLDVRYRCYPKAMAQKPPPFTTMTSFPSALTLTDIPNCGGPNVNQVEFEFTRKPKTRYTRFDMLSVTAVRE